jgi:prolyl-tRNA synthetase
MGVIVEKLADDKGIVWPESVAPFTYHVVSLGKPGDEVAKAADELYEEMAERGVAVLYDDRDVSAGQKFAESDLIGIPKRIVVGKEAAAHDLFEVVDRATGKVDKKPHAEIL